MRAHDSGRNSGSVVPDVPSSAGHNAYLKAVLLAGGAELVPAGCFRVRVLRHLAAVGEGGGHVGLDGAHPLRDPGGAVGDARGEVAVRVGLWHLLHQLEGRLAIGAGQLSLCGQCNTG